ncbi:MAG: hypothetical protein WC477_01250 [Patescibacteria group bacterium]
MKRWLPIFLLAMTTIIAGWGCTKKTTQQFVPAPSSSATSTVAPNAAGGTASTGNMPATVTPEMNTETLVKALPDDGVLPGYQSAVPEEKKNPVPLPDGTKAEYTTLVKIFTTSTQDSTRVVSVSITDTRGLPVLTAFLDSYAPYLNDSGYRKKIDVSDQAWITYTNDPTGGPDGFGNVTMLLNNRFLIQIDGNKGVTAETLQLAASSVHQDALR